MFAYLFKFLRKHLSFQRRPGPRIPASMRWRPCLDVLEGRLQPAASIVATATSSLDTSVPLHFTLYDNGVLTGAQGNAAPVQVATGIQGLYQGVDSAGDQVAYDLGGHVLYENFPHHGWIDIGAADQAAQDGSGHVYFRQGSNLLMATGVPTSTTAGYQAIATGGVQALAQYAGGQVLFLQGNELDATAGTSTPVVGIHNVLGLAQDGPNQVLYLDGGGTLDELPADRSNIEIVASNVQTLVQNGFQQALYLTNGTLMSITSTGTPVQAMTGVQTLAEAHNLLDYVIRNGSVSALTPTDKLVPVSGAVATSQLLVDGRDQLYGLSASGTLQRITGLSAQTIAWGVTSHAIDSAGELVVLEGPALYQYFTGQYTIGGINTGVKFALDASGDLYSIDRKGTLAMAATSKTPLEPIATGVTQVAIDGAGELVYLQGPYTWNYILPGGLATSGTSISGNGNPPPDRFALDMEGNLYELAGGTLTVAANSLATPQQLATGVTALAGDSGGQVVTLQGVHTYAYYGGPLGLGGSSTSIQYAIDPAGRLYSRYSSGALFAAATATSTPVLVATNVTHLAMDQGGEVVLLKGGTAYEYFTGPLAVSGSAAGSSYALDGRGNLYTLSAGTVTISSASTSAPAGIATGIIRLFMDSSGQVALFSSSGQLSYYDPIGQRIVPILSNQAQAELDVYGQLYTRGTNDIVYKVTPSGATPVDYLALSIGFSPAGTVTAALAATGPIYQEYLALAGETDAYGNPVQPILGLPTGSAHTIAGISGEYILPFQGGEIEWSSATGAHVVYGGIGTEYSSLGGATGVLGLPTSDEQADAAGRVVHFQGGDVIWSSSTGAHAVVGAVLASYDSAGGASSTLGLPVEDARQSPGSTDPATRIQLFQYGQIYAPHTGAAQFIGVPTATGGLGLWGGFSVSQVTPNGIDQSQAGTCSFLSALSSVARTDPQLLANHLTQNFDGTWSVTLYDASSSQWRTTTVSLTTFNSGDPYPGPNNTNFWTAVFQRAYLQLMGVDMSSSDPRHWHAPGDQLITYADGTYTYQGNWQQISVALQSLTGNAANYTPIASASWQAIQTALAQGLNVEAGTNGTSDSLYIGPGVVGHHAYMVAQVIVPPPGLYLTGQPVEVVLRNPWGFDPTGQPISQGDGKNDGYITMPWSEFVSDYFGYYTDSDS
jgi:hypothetical protein